MSGQRVDPRAVRSRIAYVAALSSSLHRVLGLWFCILVLVVGEGLFSAFCSVHAALCRVVFHTVFTAFLRGFADACLRIGAL